jgi:hypothetical protein
MTEFNEYEQRYLTINMDDMDAESRAQAREYRIRDIEKRGGHIVGMDRDRHGFPRFEFADGFQSTIAPRGYRFWGPLDYSAGFPDENNKQCLNEGVHDGKPD